MLQHQPVRPEGTYKKEEPRMKSQTDSTYNPITEGVIWKQILIYFFPIFIGSLFQMMYNTVDTIIVGRYVGTQAIAAVGGSAAQITHIITNLFVGTSAGATVAIAQFIGSRNAYQVHRHLHNAYALCFIGGVIFTAIGLILTMPLLRLMNTGEEIIYESARYMRIYFAGMIFTFIYNMGAGILRAAGDSKRPLYYLIVSCVTNIILDILLVSVIPMGVAGVALATIISQAVSSLLVTLKLMRSEGLLHLDLKEIRAYGDVMKVQLKIGLPSGLSGIMYGLSNSTIQAFLNGFGTDTVAAYSIYGKIDSLFWMIDGAFGTTITTFVGQNYGAGSRERVKKSISDGALLCSSAAVIASIAVVSLRFVLVHIFTSEPQVVDIAAHFIQMISPFYIAFVAVEVCSCSLRGMGHVIVSTILTLSGICVLRIVWMILVAPHLAGLKAITLIYPISWIVTGTLFIIYLLWFWKNRAWKGNPLQA